MEREFARRRFPRPQLKRANIRTIARCYGGLGTWLKQEGVDKKEIAAIGYCFGGTTVLELARSGADVGGVVSFHGGLGSPTPEDAKNIKAKVLALHGADDPHVPPAEVAGFEE